MLAVSVRHRFARRSTKEGAGGPDFALDAAFTTATPGVTALFGPSGSGKSTLLAVVAGLLRPTVGLVALGDRVLLDTASGIVVPVERRRCGVVFQDARLFPHMSVADNLRYGSRRAARSDGTRDDGPTLADVVELLGIADLLHRRPGSLSGGEKQRVALGRALLSRPRILLMDEPLAALDGPRKAEVLPFLARLRDVARLPILYVTHALDEVDALADQLVLLDGGRVLAAGPVEAMSARTDLPLAARRDAGVLLACTIADHAPARGLTRLSFAGGELWLPLRPEPIAAQGRVRLRARDVTIAVGTAPPHGLSTHNILKAQLQEITPTTQPHEVFLRLAVGPSTLLARVTRDTVDRLSLSPGQSVWALIKSVVFDHRAPEW